MIHARPCLFAVSLVALSLARDVTAQDKPKETAAQRQRVSLTDGQRKIDLTLVDGAVVAAHVDGAAALVRLGDNGRISILFEDKEVAVVEPAPEPVAPPVRLDVTMGPVDESLASHLDVKTGDCCMVLDAPEGGVAQKAGLRKFDVIVAVDGQAPATEATVQAAVRGKKPGDRIAFKVLRHGGPVEIEATLERPRIDLDPALLATRRLLLNRFNYPPLTFELARGRVSNLSFPLSPGTTHLPSVQLTDPATQPDIKTEVQALRQQLTQVEQLLRRLEKRLDDK